MITDHYRRTAKVCGGLPRLMLRLNTRLANKLAEEICVADFHLTEPPLSLPQCPINHCFYRSVEIDQKIK